jgi:hypothetical protein
MEVRQKAHEIAVAKRPDYGEAERKPVEMEMER